MTSEDMTSEGMRIDKVTHGITISFTAKTFLTIFAFGIYWGLVFAAYWGTPYLAGSFDVLEVALQRICCALCGQAMTFACILALWRQLSNLRGINLMEALPLLFCTVGGLPALCQAIGVTIPHPAAMVCVFVFGCGHALLLCRIGFLMDALTGPSMLPAIALSAFVACAVFTVVVNLDGLVQAIVLTALPWLSCGCVFATRPSIPIAPGDFDGCRLAECSNDGARSEFTQFCTQMLLYSIVFSAAQLLAQWFHEGAQNDSFWGIIIVAGAVMLIYSLFVNRYVPAPVFMWYLLPVIALGALPICIADTAQRAVCWLVVGFGFTVFDFVSFQLLSSFIKFNNLSIVRYFSIGRLANAAGMVVGWAIGCALFTAVPPGPVSIGFLFIGLIVVLITTMCLFSRPSEKSQEAVGTDPHEEKVESDPPVELRRPWREVVAEISREVALSPREKEVFILLSHGRNAHYIGDHLFISPATAKTHIYRIYQKLGIKSQQALIDLVEERYLTSLSKDAKADSPQRRAADLASAGGLTPTKRVTSAPAGRPASAPAGHPAGEVRQSDDKSTTSVV